MAMNIPRYHAKRERRRMRSKLKSRWARIVQLWQAIQRKRRAKQARPGGLFRNWGA